jgi:hypothetical protein
MSDAIKFIKDNYLALNTSENEIKCQTEIVTPELAYLYLEGNSVNRNVRPATLKKYINMLKRDEWQYTHQGIAISKTNRLLDGQHRLWAIIETGIPAKMLVFRNCDDNTFNVLDYGATRSISDHTGISAKTAGACRYVALGLAKSNIVSVFQIKEVYETEFGALHEELMEYCKSTAPIINSTAFRVAAVLNMILGFDKNNIKEIYKNLTMQNSIKLPPVAYQFLKSVNLRQLDGNTHQEIFCKAMKIFNPKYANQKFVKASADEIALNNEVIRDVMRRIM